MLSTHARFWSKVEQGPDGCWLWTATTATGGYGNFGIKRLKKTVYAHRYAYEEIKGQIPDGLQIDHLCRVRSCVNPDHMEAVTRTENLSRGFGPAAVNARKVVCVRGHPYNETNTRYWRNKRLCRICDKILHREAYEMKPD